MAWGTEAWVWSSVLLTTALSYSPFANVNTIADIPHPFGLYLGRKRY